MGKKLSSYERDRRRREKERERERAAARRARERAQRRRERESERAQIRREKATERERVRREREREKQRQQRATAQRKREKEEAREAQRYSAERTVQRYEARLAWLRSSHPEDIDLDDFLDEMEERQKPRSTRVLAFQPAKPLPAPTLQPSALPPVTATAPRAWPEFEPAPRAPQAGAGVLGIAVGLAGAYAWSGFDASQLVSDWVPVAVTAAVCTTLALLAGVPAFVFGAAKRLGESEAAVEAYEQEQSAADRAQLESQRTVRHKRVKARQVSRRRHHESAARAHAHTGRLQTTLARTRALARRSAWEEVILSSQIQGKREDRLRRRVLDDVRAGDPTTCTAVLRHAFPLALPAAGRKGPNEWWETVPTGGVQGYVGGGEALLRVEIPVSGVVPTKVVGLASSGLKNSARKMAVRQRSTLRDEFIASWALTHALRAWQVLPDLERVVVEVWEPGTDPASGKAIDLIRLSVVYPRQVLEDTVLDSVSPLALLERVDHEQRPSSSKSKKLLVSRLPGDVSLVALNLADRTEVGPVAGAWMAVPEYQAEPPTNKFAQPGELAPATTRCRLVLPTKGHPVPADLAHIPTTRHYTDLDAAVRACAPGDIVTILGGTWSTPLQIKVPLTLVGTHNTTLRVDERDCARIYSPGVHLHGLTIERAGSRTTFDGPVYLGKHGGATLAACTLRSNTRYTVWQGSAGTALVLWDCVFEPLDDGPDVVLRFPPEARSSVQRCEVVGPAETGIHATDLDADHTTVRGCETGVSAPGDLLDPDDAFMQLEACTIADCAVGVSARRGAVVQLVDPVLRHNGTDTKVASDARVEVV